jgi:hypothetical protein
MVERMKLQQGQIWKCAGEYVRVVHLERLEVGYKSFKSLKSPEGVHQHTSKKDFCRLLKGATLLSPVKPAASELDPPQPPQLKVQGNSKSQAPNE